jgi:hypothetical protein
MIAWILAMLALPMAGPASAPLFPSVRDSVPIQRDTLTLAQKIEALGGALGFRMQYLRDTVLVDHCRLRRMLGVSETAVLPPHPVLKRVLSEIPNGGCAKHVSPNPHILVAKIEWAPSGASLGKMAKVELQIYRGHYYHDESYLMVRDLFGPKPRMPYAVASMAIYRYGTQSRIDDFKPNDNK